MTPAEVRVRICRAAAAVMTLALELEHQDDAVGRLSEALTLLDEAWFVLAGN